MALFGIVFLALLVLGLSTCIVGLAIWLIAFGSDVAALALEAGKSRGVPSGLADELCIPKLYL